MLVVGLAAVGIGGVLVGDRRADETVPTLGPIVLQDTFTRSPGTNGLGMVSRGHPWRVPAGQWTIIDGQAAPRPPAGLHLAVIAPGRSQSTVAVTLTELREGAGVVVDYVDRQNYLRLVAAPAFATWNLLEVRSGVERSRSNIGLSSATNGDRITLRRGARQLCVYVNSVQHTARERCFSLSAPPKGARVGLFASDRGDEVRFDNFVVSA